ncbi:MULTISPECIES: hypothetical protein [unclassified Bradyrhizobium]
MGQVFDEADYRRRLDALDSSNISVGEEAGLIAKGGGSGPLDARKTILFAKQQALRAARKKMIKAIRAEQDRMRQNNLLPTEVEQIVTGKSDTLVKV